MFKLDPQRILFSLQWKHNATPPAGVILPHGYRYLFVGAEASHPEG
jgi:hypothetical protein